MFAALGDPTRLSVVERLGRGPASVSDLAGNYAMALPSFMKHLKQLEASGLVRTEKQGRIRTCTLEPLALTAVDRWIADRRRDWHARFDRLGAYLDRQETPND